MVIYSVKVGDAVRIIGGEHHDKYGKVSGYGKMIKNRINGKMRPGIYYDPLEILIMLDVGIEIMFHITEIELYDLRENERRKVSPNHEYQKPIFIKELPESKFYEMDKIIIKNSNELNEISNVSYIYDIELDDFIVNGYTIISEEIYFFSEEEIELYERGNLWKYLNKMSVSFNSIEEKIQFFISIGEYEIMETCVIDKELLKEKIMNREIDGFVNTTNQGKSCMTTVIKFSDVSVGSMIRNEFIEKMIDLK